LVVSDTNKVSLFAGSWRLGFALGKISGSQSHFQKRVKSPVGMKFARGLGHDGAMNDLKFMTGRRLRTSSKFKVQGSKLAEAKGFPTSSLKNQTTPLIPACHGDQESPKTTLNKTRIS
jgi:hypothetical protein